MSTDTTSQNGQSASLKEGLALAFNTAVMDALIGGVGIAGAAILTTVAVAGVLAGVGVSAGASTALGYCSGAIAAGAMVFNINNCGPLVKPRTFWGTAGITAAGIVLSFAAAVSRPTERPEAGAKAVATAGMNRLAVGARDAVGT